VQGQLQGQSPSPSQGPGQSPGQSQGQSPGLGQTRQEKEQQAAVQLERAKVGAQWHAAVPGCFCSLKEPTELLT